MKQQDDLLETRLGLLSKTALNSNCLAQQKTTKAKSKPITWHFRSDYAITDPPTIIQSVCPGKRGKVCWAIFDTVISESWELGSRSRDK